MTAKTHAILSLHRDSFLAKEPVPHTRDGRMLRRVTLTINTAGPSGGIDRQGIESGNIFVNDNGIPCLSRSNSYIEINLTIGSCLINFVLVNGLQAFRRSYLIFIGSK